MIKIFLQNAFCLGNRRHTYCLCCSWASCKTWTLTHKLRGRTPTEGKKCQTSCQIFSSCLNWSYFCTYQPYIWLCSLIFKLEYIVVVIVFTKELNMMTEHYQRIETNQSLATSAISVLQPMTSRLNWPITFPEPDLTSID